MATIKSSRVNEEPIALPIPAFCRRFGPSPATVYRHLKSGALKYRVIGKRRYVEVPQSQVAAQAAE
jgi:hypothetical protein